MWRGVASRQVTADFLFMKKLGEVYAFYRSLIFAPQPVVVEHKHDGPPVVPPPHPIPPHIGESKEDERVVTITLDDDKPEDEKKKVEEEEKPAPKHGCI